MAKCYICENENAYHAWTITKQESLAIDKGLTEDLKVSICNSCYDTGTAESIDKAVILQWFLNKKEPAKDSAVTKPKYYIWHPLIECSKVSEQFMSNLGQAIQYIWRSNTLQPTKGNTTEEIIQDLEKARMFIQFEIDRLKELW